MDKIIFHVDVNSAFLSWSAVKILKQNPNALDLRTVPSAVGGDVKTRHGIITAKSIPAKKYGIQTAMPVVKALQLCPKLILVESDFQTYREYSHAFIDILNKYTPLIQQVSIDEAYMDITGTKMLYKDLEKEGYKFPLCVADKIRKEIRETLGFTVNVGISNNKLLAKMASDFVKPDKTHTLFPDEIEKKMWPLPISELYGCGKATSQRLISLGIKTIGDAAKTDENYLKQILGDKAGAYIYASANGMGSSIVHNEYEDAKSYSNETTISNDITIENYDTQVPDIVRWLSDKVSARMRRDGVYGGTVTVSVKTGDFKRHSIQSRLIDPTNSSEMIYETAMQLLDKLMKGPEGLFYKDASVRLIGVGASNLDDGKYRQMSLFDTMNSAISASEHGETKNVISGDKQKKLDAMTDLIQKEFGKDAVVRGYKLNSEKIKDKK
ncbi:MAG: DNA polymerase IV [Butyrivibrio sp.]|nr:DNA polymerase IV [Butyrivibrio sp.]